MPVTDPISDMFTRIRNAIRVQASAVEMPASKQKVAIAELLRREGFISSYETRALGSPEQRMRIVLKYGGKGEVVIQGLKRVSKPGLRVYRQANKMPRVYGGLGIAIVSTSQGLMTDRQARKSNLGGEVVAEVW
ncbi:MAG: 30S ribosomal protein S8 [Candidatus Melainabacteria bacterium]|jgi:small subunit ribosomal protein S8|uniref:Small ribosomal subunit protein uS8 n=1 Tax=Candidatus Obscuribacter phosphatis TaxID=1906157 RepID=A0A8J7P963_9BACT|nr:30S ribosomal protein S8 [Candidatus Obscuribacter phosphatis]MBX9940365.1 30S ribosomal protein S8 [Candidatus Obscuribacterales bacterium]MCA0313474.1 30S ribosomal protein S8 [Candidatus Melainabacteria bacterium]